jgi:Protein of unknown function (DUF2914)
MTEIEPLSTNKTSVLKHLWQRASKVLPALAFFGGFLWDALTLGQAVGTFDLIVLFTYLAGAALFIWLLARRIPLGSEGVQVQRLSFALQFCFGGLFSALFIFYFKSSSQLSAYLVTLALGALLIANEFLDDRYGRFTLTFLLFGLCCMLFFNFALPHALGSLHPVWFYVSTALGLACTYGLHRYSLGRPGRMMPIYVLSGLLVGAYSFDMIPPVPLVKKGLAVGSDFSRQEGYYRLSVESPPWYAFWRQQNATLHIQPGTRLYCVSSVFAPGGMQTRLYHRWSYHDSRRGWVTASHIGFGVSGGRQQGFRGYTYKQNLRPGPWRVSVETPNGRTVAHHDFTLEFTDTTQTYRTEVWEL